MDRHRWLVAPWEAPCSCGRQSLPEPAVWCPGPAGQAPGVLSHICCFCFCREESSVWWGCGCGGRGRGEGPSPPCPRDRPAV